MTVVSGGTNGRLGTHVMNLKPHGFLGYVLRSWGSGCRGSP